MEDTFSDLRELHTLLGEVLSEVDAAAENLKAAQERMARANRAAQNARERASAFRG